MSLETFLLGHESVIRFGFFLGTFALMALWEVLAPLRVPGTSKAIRWPNHVMLAAMNIGLVRVLFPLAAVALAVYAGERDKVRHVFAGRTNHLEADGRMFSRDTVHRVHVELMQPRLGHRPGADDVCSRAERGRDAEHVTRTFEHFQDLFAPLGIHAKEFHSPGFENAQVPARVPLHKNHLAGHKDFRPAAGGDGSQHHWIKVGELWGRRHERNYCITRIHRCSKAILRLGHITTRQSMGETRKLRRRRRGSSVAGDDRQPGGAPLRKAVFQSPSLEATCAQRRDRFVGEDAVRAAAIGDKFLRRVESGEARFQLA